MLRKENLENVKQSKRLEMSGELCPKIGFKNKKKTLFLGLKRQSKILPFPKVSKKIIFVVINYDIYVYLAKFL